MKQFISVITLTLSGLIATSAFAGPYDQDQRHYSKSAPAHIAQNKVSHFDRDRDDRKFDQSRARYNKDLRVGQTLPNKFNSSRYQVSDRQLKNLPKAGRHHQWYKINGDYVLINDRTDRIIRIIG